MLHRIFGFFTTISKTKPVARVEPDLKARDHAIQIGQINGNVYLAKKELKPLAKHVAEAIKLHQTLTKDEIVSVNKWMRAEFNTAMLKELNKADLGRALLYIRKVHERTNSRG